jgi:prevent-host-death family protein
MEFVNVREARIQLSRLLARVEAGDEVVICRDGAPVARLVPLAAKPGRRTPNVDKGAGWIADDFDAPLPPRFWKPTSRSSR